MALSLSGGTTPMPTARATLSTPPAPLTCGPSLCRRPGRWHRGDLIHSLFILLHPSSSTHSLSISPPARTSTRTAPPPGSAHAAVVSARISPRRRSIRPPQPPSTHPRAAGPPSPDLRPRPDLRRPLPGGHFVPCPTSADPFPATAPRPGHPGPASATPSLPRPPRPRPGRPRLCPARGRPFPVPGHRRGGPPPPALPLPPCLPLPPSRPSPTVSSIPPSL
nr:vegetative cell wall protein gp1-like [Aegilops tauschii subsp. strangulata]